jgi:multiple sugar transport system ATP-binding protein
VVLPIEDAITVCETRRAGDRARCPVPGVKFEGVWKLFGDVPAVRDLNVEINDGEFLVLVGPSGCGKTTSLRMLGGLELPSYGRITMGDRDVTTLAPGERDVAMVFQSYALYPHMTVYKNLAFGPGVRREPKRETHRRIQGVAEVLGIDHLLQRRPSELSGGQRQRVALGRSMIRQPQLFLLDEPLSNLDAALRVQMRTELLRLHRLLPVTTVYVTHDQVEALTMGDRVAVFNLGELLQIGSPDELYNAPKTLFVAEFIGSPKMNLTDGELAGVDGDAVTVRFLEQVVTVPDRRLVPTASAGDKLRLGIRPHDLHWDAEAPIRCSAKLAVTVDIVEHTGSEMFVVGVSAQKERVMGRVHRSADIAVGDAISFAFDPADLHLFDASTGETILQRAPTTAPEPPTDDARSNSGTHHVVPSISNPDRSLS